MAIQERLQIPPQLLLALDGFEQRFEIAFAEAPAAFALDHFVKQRRAVFTGRVKICSM